MASQMVDARVLRTTVEITGAGTERRDGGVHRVGQGDRVRRLPPRVRRRQRRSGGGARRAGNGAAEADGRRTRSTRRARRARDAARSALEPKTHETHAAGALHRSVADQGARSGRASAGRRPTRRRSARSSGAATSSARARRSCRASRRSRSRGCCAGTSAISSTSGSPPRWRRTSTRSRAASASGSTSSASSIAATSTTAASRTRSKQAEERADYPLIDVGVDPGVGRADPRPHRPLRSVPAARRGRPGQDRVAAADARRRPISRSRRRWR